MANTKTKMDKGVTLIAGHTEVVGDVRFVDQLFVSGKVIGNILSDDDKATLIIGDQGWVVGEVRVPTVVINGRCEGDVYARTKVELAPQARVQGNLYYKLIEMQLGAKVDGQLMHEQSSTEVNNVHPLSADNPAS